MATGPGTIGMVYDSTRRNNGSPVLCMDATKRGLGWGERLQRYHPKGELPKHDLYIYCDDGIDNDWVCPKPNAYWAVDTHLGYPYRLQKARQFDTVFCAQLEGVRRMKADGIENVHWLPLACHPPAHPNFSEMMVHPERDRWEKEGGLTKKFDVVFVGYINEGAGPNSHNRLEYLDRLFREFPNFWVTTNCYFEDAASRLLRGRLNTNISIRNDLNMRWFELLSIGSAMLTNTDVEGWQELGFVDGEHFIGYNGMDEMIEKTKWGLAHPMERERIAATGHKLVRAEHTYTHRMAKLLETCGLPTKPD